MRILFAGTPQFAVPSLEMIARNFTICGVLTAPDKKAGRGRKVIPCVIKQKALSLGLKVFDPPRLDVPAVDEIKSVCPDILVVAAYGKIFKEDFLDIFPMGGINIHPSLLPRHRGPSPIPAAILAGDSESGVTVQRLALKMDTGAVLSQVRSPLQGNETTYSLTERFSVLGAKAVVEVLSSIKNKTINEIRQNEDSATYCKLIKKEQGEIDWGESAEVIDRKVRAYFPWPKAYTRFKGLHLDVIKASLEKRNHHPENEPPGRVLGIDKNSGFRVKTGDGVLCISRLKLQAKREMDYKDFLNGHKDFINSQLGE